ncbi:hypothetical protein Q5752_001430 [Cryptotrichosporon argae]
MLNISLVPKGGNLGTRFYPHTGYLGVTPVHLSGTCWIKLDDSLSSIPARSLAVRAFCVEGRGDSALSSSAGRVLWETTKTLWAAEDGYEPYSSSSTPFRLTIPPEAAEAVSAMYGSGTQRVRGHEITWRVEAVLAYKPIALVGDRHSYAKFLDLHDYRALPALPTPLPSPPPSEVTLGSGSWAVHCIVYPVETAVHGPGDTINVRVGIRPIDPSTSVRRVTFVLERRLETSDEKSPPREAREPSPAVSTGSSTPPPRSRLSAMFHRGPSPKSSYARLPGSQSPPPEAITQASRVQTARLLDGACDEPPAGPDGMYWPIVTIALPPRRSAQWDLGQTSRTRGTAMSFGVRITIALRTRSRSGAKDVCGPSVSVVVVGTSTAERAIAAKALASLRAAEAAKAEESALLQAELAPKRRARSSRRGLYMHEGTLDISEPAVMSSRGRKTRSQPGSPRLAPIAIHVPAAAAVKPILLPPDHAAQTKPIQFDFSPRAVSDMPKPTLPGISSFINPYPTPASSHASLSPHESVDYYSLSILRQFQATGRRISTTTSEEEEVQPFRSRQRLSGGPPAPTTASIDPSSSRRGLPSLDTLGLGLPQVPDEARPLSRRRPRTAPAFGAYSVAPPPTFGSSSSRGSGRPMTSATGPTGSGSVRRSPPPPLQRVGEVDTAFAFSVEAPDDATPAQTPTIAQHAHLLARPRALAPAPLVPLHPPQPYVQDRPTLPPIRSIAGS